MATAIVGGILALAVGAIIWKLARDHRSGRGSCGGDCAHCRCACQLRPE